MSANLENSAVVTELRNVTFHCSAKESKWKWSHSVLYWLFATPWTVAYQAPPSMEFSRQEYWSGLPFPSPGDLPNSGIEPGSPAFQADTLTSEPPGKPTMDKGQAQITVCTIIICRDVALAFLCFCFFWSWHPCLVSVFFFFPLEREVVATAKTPWF